MVDTLVVVNPISGAGRALEEFKNFERNFEEFFSFFKISIKKYAVVYTTANDQWKHDASKYADIKNILVIGGDGTFHMVVKEFFEKFTTCRFILVPGGRGNDFSKAIYKNIDLSKPFMDWIKQNHNNINVKEVDLGIVNKYLFINMASIGYGGTIVKEVQNNRSFWGNSALAYQIEGVRKFFKKYSAHVRIEETEFRNFFAAFIGNGVSNGGGLYWCREASASDGKMNLTAFSKPSLIEMLGIFDRVKKGISIFNKRTPFTNVIQQFNTLKIHSDQMLSLECDGEYVGDFTDFDISIHIKKIFVLTV